MLPYTCVIHTQYRVLCYVFRIPFWPPRRVPRVQRLPRVACPTGACGVADCRGDGSMAAAPPLTQNQCRLTLAELKHLHAQMRVPSTRAVRSRQAIRKAKLHAEFRDGNCGPHYDVVDPSTTELCCSVLCGLLSLRHAGMRFKFSHELDPEGAQLLD